MRKGSKRIVAGWRVVAAYDDIYDNRDITSILAATKSISRAVKIAWDAIHDRMSVAGFDANGKRVALFFALAKSVTLKPIHRYVSQETYDALQSERQSPEHPRRGH